MRKMSAKDRRREGALERLEESILRYEQDSLKADEKALEYFKLKLKKARICLVNLKKKIKIYG